MPGLNEVAFAGMLQMNGGLRPGYMATVNPNGVEYSLVVDNHVDCTLGAEVNCGSGVGAGLRYVPALDMALRKLMEKFEIKLSPHVHLDDLFADPDLELAIGPEGLWIIKDGLELGGRVDFSLEDGSVDAVRASLTLGRASASYLHHGAEDGESREDGVELRYALKRRTNRRTGRPLTPYFACQALGSSDTMSIACGAGFLTGDGHFQ